MAQLAIGTDSIEIKTIIKTVKSNISLLQKQVDSFDSHSDVGRKSRQFYFNKIAIRKATLKWLIKYESQ